MTAQDATDPLAISVDAMGGDRGPAVVVAALSKLLRREPELRIVLHGDEAQLRPLIRRWRLDARVEPRHAPNVVGMADKPSAALRAADGTSMAAALDSVARGETQAAVSCGNTGALMAMSMLRLRKAPGVDRPAIAVMWPSDNASGHSIMLDAGADIRAEPETLAQFAVMGAEYARVGLELDRPRVGLLNVGAEETKGRPELRAARELIAAAANAGAFDWRGFVEGGDLFGDRVDVIVTDGFTGNIALKTAEGTAAFIGSHLRASFQHGILSRLAALMALGTLKRLKRRIDPRRVNGGVFLGLRGAVVKSHGGADATGVAAALGLAVRMARTGFTAHVAERIAAMHAPGPAKEAMA
ncbi:MAG: phosphate acyltransferase PlsX [Rubrimonas sp.]|uniref:phosphate acyltransferase PlsX n=1 Tax=Rubrimonas sp. TaxID=2036015 RepID=UPI002FDE827F